jgi:hypothetical protein
MIEVMKFDMGGAAAVFGAAKAIATIKPPGVEVVGTQGSSSLKHVISWKNDILQVFYCPLVQKFYNGSLQSFPIEKGPEQIQTLIVHNFLQLHLCLSSIGLGA